MGRLRRPTRWTFRIGPGLAALAVIVSFVAGTAGTDTASTGGAAAASSSWTIESSPDPVYATGLSSVSCIGPSDCTAVGSANAAPLIEHWDGTAWSTVPSVNPSTRSSGLYGVSCTSTTACIAVGEYYPGFDRPLTEVWNGTEWTIKPTPDPGYTNSLLQSVSCTSATFCIAVGSGTNLGGPPVPAWAAEWDGSTWTLQSTPNIGIATFLNGVSCTGPSNCTAVGSWSHGNVTSSLVESWDGSAWSIVPTVGPVGATNSYLNGVSCLGPSACVAVGTWSSGAAYMSLVEVWNGSDWWTVPSPDPSGAITTTLDGVSCAGSVCTAFGNWFANMSGAQTLVETGPSPATIPAAPAKAQATPGDQQASVSFDPPASDGGAAVNLYTVAATDVTHPGTGSRTATGPSSPIVVAGLTNGDTYTFTVSATNAVGTSPPSAASNPVVPAAAVTTSPGTGSPTSSSPATSSPATGPPPTGPPATAASPACSATLPFGTVVGMATTADDRGYWIASSTGQVSACGDAPRLGDGPSGTIAIAASPKGDGYWLVTWWGTVFAFGSAVNHGGIPARVHLDRPIVAMAADPATGGYWLLGGDGGVFAFDAPFYGSTGNMALAAPAVGMEATPDGHGYRFVASDGGIFAYGDAAFYGSMGGTNLNEPVVGMAADPATGGYWLDAADGGIFSFHAPFYGSAGRIDLVKPCVGMTASPDGHGYRFVAADGGIFAYGDAAFYGSAT